MAKRTVGSRRPFLKPVRAFPPRWFLANSAFTLTQSDGEFFIQQQGSQVGTFRSFDSKKLKARTAQEAISELAARGFREG